jgi:hypothetical protein
MWGLFGRLRFGSRTWTSPHAACEARCRESLGDRAFEAAHHRGSELTIAHAVAYAIAE